MKKVFIRPNLASMKANAAVGIFLLIAVLALGQEKGKLRKAASLSFALQ